MGNDTYQWKELIRIKHEIEKWYNKSIVLQITFKKSLYGKFIYSYTFCLEQGAETQKLLHIPKDLFPFFMDLTIMADILIKKFELTNDNSKHPTIYINDLWIEMKNDQWIKHLRIQRLLREEKERQVLLFGKEKPVQKKSKPCKASIGDILKAKQNEKEKQS